MPSCAVSTCKNTVRLKKKKDGITFHTFPADEERKSEWTKIVERERSEKFWKPSERSVVCSIHFEDKYLYETKRGLRRLRREAVPNKHLAMAPEETKSCMETSKNATPPHSPVKSNSEIGDVNISDLDYVFDTPKEAKLKTLLRRKQIVCEKQVRRIKSLQQKNRRLAKRNELLKKLLRKFKKQSLCQR